MDCRRERERERGRANLRVRAVDRFKCHVPFAFSVGQLLFSRSCARANKRNFNGIITSLARSLALLPTRVSVKFREIIQEALHHSIETQSDRIPAPARHTHDKLHSSEILSRRRLVLSEVSSTSLPRAQVLYSSPSGRITPVERAPLFILTRSLPI